MASGCSEAGLRTVSSTERMRQAASVAAASALRFMMVASHTNDSIVSQMPFSITSTPYHLPPCACFIRSLFSTSVGSIPALPATWRGTTSSALANAEIRSCCLPWMPAVEREGERGERCGVRGAG